MKKLGWLFVVLGFLLVVLSPRIVFSGIASIVGIERIVGAENVLWLPDGGYAFTNPGAQMRWIASVIGCGLLIAACGVALIVKDKKKARS